MHNSSISFAKILERKWDQKHARLATTLNTRRHGPIKKKHIELGNR